MAAAACVMVRLLLGSAHLLARGVPATRGEGERPGRLEGTVARLARVNHVVRRIHLFLALVQVSRWQLLGQGWTHHWLTGPAAGAVLLLHQAKHRVDKDHSIILRSLQVLHALDVLHRVLLRNAPAAFHLHGESLIERWQLELLWRAHLGRGLQVHVVFGRSMR